jgi:hypothetical protein
MVSRANLWNPVDHRCGVSIVDIRIFRPKKALIDLMDHLDELSVEELQDALDNGRETSHHNGC